MLPEDERGRPAAELDGPKTTRRRYANTSVRDRAAEPEQLPITGVDRALRNADDWWLDGAMRALRHEAKTGRPFAADDLAESYSLPAPDHPGRWGALFRAAHAAGLIEPIGYRQSRAASRAGGVVRVWRGVPR